MYFCCAWLVDKHFARYFDSGISSAGVRVCEWAEEECLFVRVTQVSDTSNC